MLFRELIEGDIISTKFSTKQSQKNKDQYKYNSFIVNSIPKYDPVNRKNIPDGFEDYTDEI